MKHDTSLIPVILSGGVGTRLWPASRRDYPKQFLSLIDPERSLLQQTLDRLDGLENLKMPLVVCSQAHRFLIAEQLRQQGIEVAGILLEPAGCNTALATALAALQALSKDENAELLIMPADHPIEDQAVFAEAVERGRALSGEGYLVTFGIAPQSPHIGYGYIREGEPLGPGYRVAAFAESPSISLDHAVMEHTDRAAMLRLETGWSDIGTWDAVYDARTTERDAAGNVAEGDVVLHDTADSLVISQSRLVATLGLCSTAR